MKVSGCPERSSTKSPPDRFDFTSACKYASLLVACLPSDKILNVFYQTAYHLNWGLEIALQIWELGVWILYFGSHQTVMWWSVILGHGEHLLPFMLKIPQRYTALGQKHIKCFQHLSNAKIITFLLSQPLCNSVYSFTGAPLVRWLLQSVWIDWGEEAVQSSAGDQVPMWGSKCPSRIKRRTFWPRLPAADNEEEERHFGVYEIIFK